MARSALYFQPSIGFHLQIGVTVSRRARKPLRGALRAGALRASTHMQIPLSGPGLIVVDGASARGHTNNFDFSKGAHDKLLLVVSIRTQPCSPSAHGPHGFPLSSSLGAAPPRAPPATRSTQAMAFLLSDDSDDDGSMAGDFGHADPIGVSSIWMPPPPLDLLLAFAARDERRIEFLLAAGASLSTVPDDAGDMGTRLFCEDHRDNSRLRLALTASGRPDASDASMLSLTTHLLMHGGAHLQPLSSHWISHAEDAQMDYLPDDAIEFANRVGRVGRGPQVRAARLVLRAAAPWSPAAHCLWPAAARAFVRFLLLVCKHVCPAARDVWIARVMPRLVRRSGPVSRWEMEDEAAHYGGCETDEYRTDYPWRYHEPLVW